MGLDVDLAIVGGGAAGLTTAIFAAEASAGRHRIAVLDGAKKLGAKILVSGGGRCNVTHRQVLQKDFIGTKNVVRNVLAAFGVDQTVKWFESIGVLLKQEPTGKLFPVADSARVIVDALLRRCQALNVQLQTDNRVTHIERVTGAPGDSFTIQSSRGGTTARKVVVSTGGRSLPRTGSDGAGWELLRQLGHTVTPTFAALVPLVLPPQMFHAALAGVAQDVELSVFVENTRIVQRTGSLLWTHFGISGPVVMDISRFWTTAHEDGRSSRIVCNFLPGENFEAVEQWLISSAAARPKFQLLNLLVDRLPRRFGVELLQHLGLDGTVALGQLSRDARRTLVHALIALPLPVGQHRGWNYAEVTAGGVPLEEIDYRTMESRKAAGVYLAGEVLDCDGRIGGFNFQWAWASGHLAGRSSIASLVAREHP